MAATKRDFAINYGLKTDFTGSSAGSTLFVDQFGDKVGIGTDSPSDKLEVKGTSGAGVIVISSGDTTLLGGDVIGQINFKDYDTDSHNSGDQDDYVNIKAIAKHESADGSAFDGSEGEGYDLTFSTSKRIAGAGQPFVVSEKLRITSDGKIGINNSDPLYPLHFKNAMASTPSYIHMEVTGTNTPGGGGGIAFDTSASNNQSNNTLFLATIAGIRNSADNGSNDLIFSTTHQGVNNNLPTEKLRITSGGNVLIGTDTSNTSDRFTIVDPGNAFMSLRSSTEADGHSQVIDFAVGTDDRSSSNLVSTITSAIPTGAAAGGTLKGYLAFSTNAGDDLSERLRILSDGRVIIGDGSESPIAWTPYASDAILQITDDTNAKLVLSNPGNATYSLAVGTDSDLVFKNESTTIEAMRIDVDGKVGMGVINPYYPLDVRFSSSSTVLSGGSSGDWGGAGLRLENDNTTVGSMSLIHFRSGDNADWHIGTKFVGSGDSDIVFLQEGVNEHLRIKNNGDVDLKGPQVKIIQTRPYVRIVSNAPTNNTDPRAVLSFESQNSNNDEDTYRINFWEGNSTGSTAHSNASIRYNASTSDGGDGAIRFCNENALRLFFVNRAGNGGINGSFSKGSGSFQIDHPLDSKKDTHYLRHSFIEGPQADNIYRGVVTLSNGTATLNLDTVSGMTEGTFVLVNTNVSCFTSNESDWTAVKGSVSGNILTIIAQDNASTATVSWMVVGERHDAHVKDSNTDMFDDDGKLIVEPLKYVATSDTTDND